MRPKGYYHATPGRMRVRVSSLKHKPKLARSLEVLLNSQPGIEHVSASPVTGNVLVKFDHQSVTADEVLQSLADLGHCPVSSEPQTACELDPRIPELGKSIGKQLAKAALKRALAGSPACVLLEII